MAVTQIDQNEASGIGDPTATTSIALDNSATGKGVLVMVLWYESIPTAGGFQIDGMTFAGVDLVQIGGPVGSGGTRLEFWALENAPSSSDAIDITWGGDTTGGQYTAEIVCLAFSSAVSTNVQFGVVGGNVGSGTTADVTVTKTGDSGTIYAACGTLGAVAYPHTVETIVYESSDVLLAWSMAAETTPAAPGASPSMGWNLTDLLSAPASDDWNAMAVEVQENSAVTFVSLPILGCG